MRRCPRETEGIFLWALCREKAGLKERCFPSRQWRRKARAKISILIIMLAEQLEPEVNKLDALSHGRA
jgi:hypothetical protein